MVDILQNINDEIEQTYNFLSTMKKDHLIFVISVIPILTAIFLSFLSKWIFYWILLSTILLVLLIIAVLSNSYMYQRQNRNVGNSSSAETKEKSEKTEILTLLIGDSTLINFEFMLKAISLIFLTNILIILIYLSTDLSTFFKISDTKHFLQNMKFLILIQAISFLAITFYSASKREYFFYCFKDFLKKANILQILNLKINKLKFSILSQLIFLLAILSFIISTILILIATPKYVTYTSDAIIVLIFQLVILSFFIDYFSNQMMIKRCYQKIYQLYVLKSLIISQNKDSSTFSPELNKKIIENIQLTILYVPVRFEWGVFFSAFLLIPNTAYLLEAQMDSLKDYLGVISNNESSHPIDELLLQGYF